MDPKTQSVGGRKSEDIVRAELERESRDLYKAYNPTNQDFQVVLNAAISPEVWTIKAKSEAIVPKYVLVKYIEEMTSKIIYIKSDRLVEEENERRMDKGMNKMDLHTEQPRFENRNLKNMMGKREQIANILNRGLYREYGLEGNGIRVENSRESKAGFDAGDVFGDSPSERASVMPPKQVEPFGLDNNPLDSDEDDNEDETTSQLTPEEELKQKRIDNLAKARAAKAGKAQ